MNTSYPEHTINPRYATLTFLVSALFTLLMLGTIYFFSKDNLLMGVAVLFAPIPFICIYYLFKFPKATLIVAFYCNYFALGLSRYLPAPMGLTVDGVLFLTLPVQSKGTLAHGRKRLYFYCGGMVYHDFYATV